MATFLYARRKVRNREKARTQHAAPGIDDCRSLPDQYVFHNGKFEPLSQNSFRRIWWSLMQDAGCVVAREVTEENTAGRYPQAAQTDVGPALLPAQLRDLALRGRRSVRSWR